jgi:hypothetical protein
MTWRIAVGGAMVMALASQPARAQVSAAQVWALFITTAEAAQAFSTIVARPAPAPAPAPPHYRKRRFEVLAQSEDPRAWHRGTGDSKGSGA